MEEMGVFSWLSQNGWLAQLGLGSGPWLWPPPLSPGELPWDWSKGMGWGQRERHPPSQTQATLEAQRNWCWAARVRARRIPEIVGTSVLP